MKKQDRGPAALSAADVLKAARDRVAKGWIQGVARHGDRVCMQTAMGDACFAVAPEHNEATRDACYILWSVVPQIVTQWNDAPNRTQAEVLAAFDRAIEMATAGSAAQPPPASPAPLAAPKEEGK